MYKKYKLYIESCKQITIQGRPRLKGTIGVGTKHYLKEVLHFDLTSIMTGIQEEGEGTAGLKGAGDCVIVTD